MNNVQENINLILILKRSIWTEKKKKGTPNLEN